MTICQLFFLFHTTEYEDRGPPSSSYVCSSPEKDETDSMHDATFNPPRQDWPESRHRRMESKRKQMMEASLAEAGRQPASFQPAHRPQRLLEFATFATGPQSPLLRTPQIDWEWAR